MAEHRMSETPQFVSSAYTSSSTQLGAMGLGALYQAGQAYGKQQGLMQNEPQEFISKHALNQRNNCPIPAGRVGAVSSNAEEKKVATPARRLVKVIIVDPDENLPLENCLLYSGEEKLTDATDQELFFELDIKTMLSSHNEKRVKVVDKKVKERTEYLEPAKIRDLKMVVVNVASF
jgi:hypothetical protein